MESDKREIINALDVFLDEIERLRNFLKRQKPSQVRTNAEREMIRAVSLNWFEKYEGKLPKAVETVSQINNDFQLLDGWSRFATSRKRYLNHLKLLKAHLIQLRSVITSGSYQSVVQKNVPDLEKIVPDSTMRQIIYRRWNEIEQCVSNAPLACVVMIGALLEALILARINKLDNKNVIFKLKSTPRDQITNKPRNLSDWTLNNYISVANEMGWVRRPARDVSTTIMEYRNLIHPEKQWRLGILLEPQDSRMFFAIFNELSRQIIESV